MDLKLQIWNKSITLSLLLFLESMLLIIFINLKLLKYLNNLSIFCLFYNKLEVWSFFQQRLIRNNKRLIDLSWHAWTVFVMKKTHRQMLARGSKIAFGLSIELWKEINKKLLPIKTTTFEKRFRIRSVLTSTLCENTVNNRSFANKMIF